MLKVHPRQRTELSPPSLLQVVKDYLRALETPQVDLTYDARLALRKFHVEELRAAVTRAERGGFTLVEVLVAVGLIVMLMGMFTSIFTMATQAMAIQRGMSQNDQKARLVQNLLRSDLNGDKSDKNDPTKPRSYRTFRNVTPFAANENGYPCFSDTDRCGYFYISENDPDNDADDLLQLTVAIPESSTERFYGRAATVLPSSSSSGGLGGLLGGLLGSLGLGGLLGPSPGTYWPNQPEFDDLQGTPNQAGSSTLAEVAYFLRNGNLYRRVMLIRKPNVSNPPVDATPLDLLGIPLSLDLYSSAGTKNFYTDFDYATFFDGSQVRFHGANSLTWGCTAFPLTNPAFRFGFDGTSNPGSGFGLPREYVGTNFIGRFTHAETSHPNFNFPGRVSLAHLNPLQQATPLTYSKGIVTTYANGPRANEDLLVTNIHGFDIKVWDPAATSGPDGLPGIAHFDDDGINGTDDAGEMGAPGSDDGAFRDLGHRGKSGYYKYLPSADRPNNYYSNSDQGHNRFDTWGPTIDLDGDWQHDQPPFRPVCVGADRRPGKAHFDDDGCNGIDDAGELGWPGTDDVAPLTAIQIKIRFYDTATHQLREVTSVHSLVCTP